MSEWINVDERLPETNRSVLAYRSGKGVGNFYINGQFEWMLDGWGVNTSRTFDDITHWMPLPPPPEADE